MASRVYEYGLLPPTKNAKLVDEQISAAHKYRNVLTEIEIERRTKVYEVLSSHANVAPLEAQLKTLRDEREQLRQTIKLTRAKTRSRSESAELRAKVKILGGQIFELRGKIKAIKVDIAGDPTIQTKIKEVNEHAAQRRRDERGKTTTFWGTYLLVEADADAASKSVTPPKFSRWTGEGRVSVQLQGGLPADDVFKGIDRRVQIDAVNARIFEPHATRSERRKGSRTVIRLRVSSEGRDPIWAEWPMILHRPLPKDARIKVATISRRRRNCRMWDWRLHLTLELPDEWTRGQSGTGVCALNLGWAQRPGGTVRAGYVVGDDKAEREILVPFSVIDRVEKAESIRSIRDKNLDEMRPVLATWLADHLTVLPEWLKERVKMIHAWRSPARFAALAFAWRKQRFEGDAIGYDLLEAWRYRDQHLQCYESGMMRSALNHRREVYRLAAIELAERYHTLVIDDTNLKDFQDSPKPEEARVKIDTAKRNQRHAAGSELRRAFVNAFTRVGGKVVKLGAENVTRACHVCSDLNDWDRADGEREHACQSCGAVWDQDANACRNLLKRFNVNSSSDTARVGQDTTIKKESRSERLRRGRQNRNQEAPLDS